MAQNQRPTSAKDEQELMSLLWDPELVDDPYRWVMTAFPWGQAGTPLASRKGPRRWQRRKLERLRDHIAQNKKLISQGKPPVMHKGAVVSGRGIGKSALVAMIVLWFISTRIGATVILAANSESQLKDKTMAEVGKWHTLLINTHWFEKSTMSLRPAQWFEDALKKQLKVDTSYYYANAQLWTEEKPDAFAGVHNDNGVLVIFDEASGIPKAIWTVTSGFFTEMTPNRFWFAFSNGRRNTGSFFECFHANRRQWDGESIDSRTVEDVDVAELNTIIEQHGEDSDEAAIEVKGGFPKQGDKQFISRGIVDSAIAREIAEDRGAPLMMGVDPARFGDDETVIRFRQGRDAKVIPAVKMKGADNMEVANRCAELILKYNPDAVCIDGGNGSGIIDRLKEMKFKVHEVGFGTKSPKPQWANYRTYLWAEMRDWLGGGAIDDDEDLKADLTAPEYRFQSGTDKIRLETKEELKARGFSSPDNADALCCTFAVKVARADTRAGRGGARQTRVARDVDYDVFGS